MVFYFVSSYDIITDSYYNMLMEKINHFNLIEKLVYDNPVGRQIRFVNIISHDNENIFYYDCLLGDVVLLKRSTMMKWKNGDMLQSLFPFSNYDNVNVKEQPSFHKHPWDCAVNQANEMVPLLEKFLLDKSLNISLYNDIEKVIEHIKGFFGLKNLNSFVYSNLQSRNSVIENKNKLDLENDILYEKLESPKLFKDLQFTDKHKNSIYLLLEKIFSNFEILSKYKMTHMYIQIKNIDAYLVNHMKNIFFSQGFSMINIEDETVSILTKINEYLVNTIDQYLEECIDNQLSIMDSIHKKFKIVNEV